MKKISKKLLSVFTALAMIFTIFASPVGEIAGFMGDSVKASAATTYNASEAVEYASNHWNDGVGLCASFVSACLNAGGCSASSSGVSALLTALTNGGYGTKYQVTTSGNYAYQSQNSGKLSAGDPVFYYCSTCGAWKHTAICSGYDSSGRAMFYGHNEAWNNETVVAGGFIDGSGHTGSCITVYSFHMNSLSKAQEKIEEIKQLFPEGSYFNANGNACSHSQSETCYNCMLYGVLYGNSKANGTAASALLSDQSYTSSYTCCAFARFVFYNIFGHKHTTNTTKISSSTYGGINDSFMSQLKPGDYLECYKNGTLVHYAVFLYADTANDKYYIAEANYSKPSDVAYTKARSYSSYSSLVAYRSNSYEDSTSPSYSTIATATYFIKNTSTNTYLSVDSGTDANKQNISVASKSNTNAFKWKFTNPSGKAYKIRPLCSTSRLLNPYGSTVSSGNNVNLYDDTDSTQWWYFEAVDDGYVIRNYANSSCVLDISGTNVLVSTYVEGKQSQIWTLTPVDLVQPTITLDKSTYEVGDTVNISWAATPSSTNFSHYWLRVISPAGDNLVHKSMGSVNNYALTVTEEGTYTIIASTTPVGSPNGENSFVETKTFEVGHEHSYTSKVTKAATCTATGVRTYTCSECGDSYTETIAKTGHNYSVVTVGSTFTQEGYSIYTCDDCGDTYTGGYFDKMTLPSIDSFALKARNYNSITLSWTENAFATGYIIQQYKNSAWTNIANISDNTTTSYQITGLAANTSYKFRAVAYVTEDGTTAYSSYTSALTVSTAPTMTTNFAITGRGSDYLTVSWTKNTGASGYVIQEQINGTWTKVVAIKGNTTTSYKITGLEPNSFHRYRMVAYKTDSNGTCYGKYTGSAPGYTAPAMVSGFKVSNIGTNSLTVSWSKVASANGYVIDIYKDGKWSQLAKITSNATTSYKASGLTLGTTYKFRIKSYATNSSLTIYSTYSSAVSGVPALSKVTNLTMTNRGTDFISVRWDKNSDADGYMVYVYMNGSWLCVKTLTSNSAVSNRINGLASGTIYKIAVKSYKTINGTRYVSDTTTISAVTL